MQHIFSKHDFLVCAASAIDKLENADHIYHMSNADGVAHIH
jgi:hypothetical protein